MCGLFGSIVPLGELPSARDKQLHALRDLMRRRGPDGAGSWQHENVVLAHRRLAVQHPGPAGDQPMHSADGRWVVAYNGELYNDPELRAELQQLGVRFRGHCDTETLVEAFAAWGEDALSRLRGMYAIAAWDRRERRLVLARDPLGVKPLYWWCDGRELVFGSDVRPVVGHPAVGASPDWQGISAYLTTLASTRGQRTLFEGVSMLEPGGVLTCETGGTSLHPRLGSHVSSSPVDPTMQAEEAAEELGSLLADSVQRQLTSDVPLCSLLSGGIDSVTIAHLARPHRDSLLSYAAGSHEKDEDLVQARECASALGTDHAEARVEREDFLESWDWMIQEGGLPLSTPNEIAIHRVSRRLAEDGCVVTLSGEGADELLAGYEAVVRAAEVFEAAPPPDMCGGRFQLEALAWVPSGTKAALLRPEIWGSLENDGWLVDVVRSSFQQLTAESGPEADCLDPHLRFLRRWNLTVLLERLDRATMLASVEGRVPFADSEVQRLCERMPTSLKLGPEDGELPAGKLILRQAMRGRIPEAVVQRPKASFPLPFQGWIAERAGELRESRFAREVLLPEAIEAIVQDPVGHWQLAWPLMNLARWGDHWFESAA